MLNKLMARIEPKEALALIGLGLFVFGIWQIYKPAAYIAAGSILMIPFVQAVRSSQ